VVSIVTNWEVECVGSRAEVILGGRKVLINKTLDWWNN